MVNVDYEDFSIDKVTLSSKNEWYTYAGFTIVETKKKWGIFNKKFKYSSEDMLLLICSKNIQKDSINEIQDDEYKKRLIQDSFDEKQIEDYVKKKILEARQNNDIESAFKCLDKYFVIND